MAESPARRLVIMPFLHSFEPGGVERVALRLCGAWVQDPALDVRLVLGRESGALAGEAPAGVERHVIPEPFPTAAWETIWMMIVLWRQIRAQQPDVLFAAGNTYAVVAVMMKLLLGRHCPPVVLKVSNDLARADLPAPIRRTYYLWLRLQGWLIDYFTGLAEPMRAEIETAMRVTPDRVDVIDDPALSESDRVALATIGDARRPSANGRRYVAIGRLAAQKNLALLLQAFALAAGPDDTLAIIGEGGERARLERRILALRLADRVKMPGHGAIGPALADADIYVLSSDYEGVPAVVIEALASGLPVVATDCSVSMRRLVGDFGSIVAVGDAPALADAMRRQPLLTEEQRRSAADAMRSFTVERAAQTYAALFRQAAYGT